MNIKLIIFTAFCFAASFMSCGTDEPAPTPDTVDTTAQVAIDTVVSDQVTLTVDDKIALIKAEFQRIESNLSQFQKKMVTAEADEEWEIIELEGFYEGENIVKITNVESYGHGTEKTSYYLRDSNLFFVFEQSSEEASVNGPFTDREVRTYIHEGELIRVLVKEETLETFETIDLSDIENEDITASIEDHGKWVANMLESLQTSLAHLEPNVLTEKSIERNFSNPEEPDVFTINITGPSLLEGTVHFEIVSDEGNQIYVEEFPSAVLFTYDSPLSDDVQLLEEFLKKRIATFFDAKQFHTPAIGAEEQYEGTIDQANWDEIKADENAVGFSFQSSPGSFKYLAYSKMQKKVVVYSECC